MMKINKQNYLKAITLGLGLMFSISTASAALIGADIVGGSASISYSAPDNVIVQNSADTAINWNSFSISADETVTYIQPSSDSVALLRVLDNNATVISGSVEANGTLIISNPNGIYLTDTAQIFAERVILTDLYISNDDFINGNYIFDSLSTTDNGGLDVNGLISATDVWLIGSGIIELNNELSIIADGSLNILSGAHYEVNLTAVPVPTAMWLFASGLIGLAGFARRK